MSYRVQSGDSLSGIAARNGISLGALEAANPQVSNPNLIYVGQSLNIPGQSDSFAPSSGGSYTVRPGDTMSGIAARNGVSLGALEAANPQVSNPNLISIGQRLNLPGGAPSAPAAPSGGSYTVQPGDTMSGIAARNGVSLGALEAANPQVSNPNLISIGQRLNLPGGAAPSAPSQPSSPGSGVNGASVARQFLGMSEYQLQPSGALDMDQWVPKDVDCANFVSGCLEKAGQISPSQRSDNVVQLAANLRNAGWQDVGIGQAQPGDVVCFDGPEGSYQHVEMFDHWDGSTPVFIGSNNTMSDGTQAIGYDHGGTWASNFHVLHNPNGGSAAPSAPSAPSGSGGTYTVQAGDTMSGIAARNGISLGALEAANPQVTNPNLISIGQTLNLPGGSPAAPATPPAAPATGGTYTVQSGDTMSGIAARAGVSLAALEAANPQVTNPNVISVGQTLNLPSGATSVSGPAPTGNAPTGNVATWIAQAQAILAANGVPASLMNAADINTIIMHESSGNPRAENDWDSNWVAGHPSKGLMQCIDSTFNAHCLPGHTDIWNPVDNIIAGVRYAIARYGSIGNVPGIIAVHNGGSYVGY